MSERAEVDYAMSADRSIALLGTPSTATTITDKEAGYVAALFARYARDAAEVVTWLQMCGLAS